MGPGAGVEFHGILILSDSVIAALIYYCVIGIEILLKGLIASILDLKLFI